MKERGKKIAGHTKKIKKQTNAQDITKYRQQLKREINNVNKYVY
jgi:hypothetical protein